MNFVHSPAVPYKVIYKYPYGKIMKMGWGPISHIR